MIEDDIAAAAEMIRRGGLVAFPTETVYGLGANALNAAAVQQIYRVKDRPASSPLIVHVADIEMAKRITGEWPPLAQTLANRFWPGPITMVLKKTPAVPDIVTANLPSVGIRMPANQIALELVRQSGVPIAAPSANKFTHISPTTAEHVRASLGDFGGLILDGGSTTVGIESTVVSLTREQPMVLRPGMISQAQLQAATGCEWQIAESTSDSHESPGLHARHYAPRTPFYLLASEERLPPGSGRVIGMPSEANEYGAALYATLHQADREGWDWIAVRRPPATPEWTAILDRLRRAATRSE